MGKCFYLLCLIALLSLCTAELPFVSLESPKQSEAGIPLNFTGSPFPSPSPGATALSANIFPPVYQVPHTNPQITFQVLPGIQKAYLPYPLAYSVVHGLNVVVEQCVLQKGDAKIPANGVAFAAASVGVSIKSSAPGSIDINYSMAAIILRGIWELTAYYGSFTLTVDVYVNTVGRMYYGGRAAVFIALRGSNTTVDVDAPLQSGTTS